MKSYEFEISPECSLIIEDEISDWNKSKTGNNLRIPKIPNNEVVHDLPIIRNEKDLIQKTDSSEIPNKLVHEQLLVKTEQK